MNGVAKGQYQLSLRYEDTRTAQLSIWSFPRVRPVLLVLGSSICFSGMHTFARYCTHNLHVSVDVVLICRGIHQAAISTVLITALGINKLRATLTRTSIVLLVIRGLLGATSAWCKYSSLSLLPVGVASTIFTTVPVFASFLAWLFLNESLSAVHYLALLTTLTGAVLVGSSEAGVEFSLISLQSPHLHGVLFGIMSALLTGFVYVLVRAMGTKVHFSFSVLAASMGAVAVPFLVRAVESGGLGESFAYFSQAVLHMTSDQLLGVLGLGMCAFGGAACLNRGLQLIEAGKASLLRTCDIPVNFLAGLVFFGELPSGAAQIAGCVLIALSTLVVVAMGS